MNNIFSNLFKRLLTFISNITDYILNIPYIFKNAHQQFILFIHDQKMKLGNLAETNIELGKYHLRNGHIKDAILRFRIAKALFDTNNPEINYWLGWCYFLKPDYLLATEYLSHAKDTDIVGLGNFIKNPDDVSEAPPQIWSMIRSLTITEGSRKYSALDFYNKPIELPLEFI